MLIDTDLVGPRNWPIQARSVKRRPELARREGGELRGDDINELFGRVRDEIVRHYGNIERVTEN